MSEGVRGLACAVVAAWAVSAHAVPPGTVWLRVVNGVGGPVQVRLGETAAWATLGRVIQPATRTAPGFGAGRWASAGTVAATAVHGIRIKVADGEFGPMISLVPRQFAAIPKLYGGHDPGSSGIRTDIGAGETLFREWAPVTGSPVYLETASCPMPLPAAYQPAPGDVLMIRSQWPAGAPTSIEILNQKGGRVSATYMDGRVEPLGTVSQPLSGVGRFDGTSYTGVGYINTNHPGVITVSTAPFVVSELSEGASPERRGGFEISPSAHVRDQASGAAAVMGVAPLPGEPDCEGRSPLFGGALALWPGSPEHPGFHVEMQVDGGAWEPLPAMVGRDAAAFTAKGLPRYLAHKGKLHAGLTALRIVLPRWDAGDAMARFADVVKAQPTAKPEPTGVYVRKTGTVSFTAQGAFQAVTYTVDGDVRAVGNGRGFTWRWDTRQEENGRHWLEIRRTAGDGGVRTEVRRILVLNGKG